MHSTYDNPLISRYASREMAALWSDQRKFSTWRQLWVWLAESEAELGLPITKGQIAELAAHINDIDFDAATTIRTQAPPRRDGPRPRLRRRLPHGPPDHPPRRHQLLRHRQHRPHPHPRSPWHGRRPPRRGDRSRSPTSPRNIATSPRLGFTHLQPAQPTTVGRRACLWAYDLALDLAEVEHRIDSLKARSIKGTTGTQASFLELFGGDHDKVRRLEAAVAKKMGFDRHLRHHRPNLLAQDRRPSPRHPRRHRRQQPQSRDRPPHPRPPQGNRRALRSRPDRLLRDGLQAQPHALRTHLRPRPLRHEPRRQRRRNARHAMDGAHARRLRQPPPHHPASLPRDRRRF